MDFENQINQTQPEQESEEQKPEEILRVCAWCDKEQGITRNINDKVKFTHGICEKHSNEIRQSIPKR